MKGVKSKVAIHPNIPIKYIIPLSLRFLNSNP